MRDVGDGFKYFDLPVPLGRVAVPICMGVCGLLSL
jgi:hypothetical protein